MVRAAVLAAFVIAAMSGGGQLLATDSPEQTTGPVTIVNSGSTNVPGFQIVIDRTGNAVYNETGRRFNVMREKQGPAKPEQRRIASATVTRLYADLAAAAPLSAMPSQHCAKSVSFGTKLTMEYGEEQTPDLSCPGAEDPHVKALMRDATAIINVFRPRGR